MAKRRLEFPAGLFGQATSDSGLDGFGRRPATAKPARGKLSPGAAPQPPREAREQMESLSRLLEEFRAEQGTDFGRRRKG